MQKETILEAKFIVEAQSFSTAPSYFNLLLVYYYFFFYLTTIILSSFFYYYYYVWIIDNTNDGEALPQTDLREVFCSKYFHGAPRLCSRSAIVAVNYLPTANSIRQSSAVRE